MFLCFSLKSKFKTNLLKVDFCPYTHLVIVRCCFNMPPFLLERLQALTKTFELCRHFQLNNGSDYSYLCSNEPPYKLPSPTCNISFHPLVLLFSCHFLSDIVLFRSLPLVAFLAWKRLRMYQPSPAFKSDNLSLRRLLNHSSFPFVR